MLRTCISKELLLNIKSMRLLLTSALLMVTMVATTALRASLFVQEREDTQQARIAWQALHERTCSAQNSLTVGTMTEMEPRVLSIFAGGLHNEMSRAMRLWYNPWRGEYDPLSGRRRFSSSAFRWFFVLDPALVIALVGSLIALVLIFDAVGSEREQGTLALQLAGPLPRDTILTAKVIAGLVTLVVPLILAWVAGLTWALLQTRVSLSAEDYQRLGIMAGLSVLLVTAFFAVGIAVSAWTRRPATALGICLLAWIGQGLIVPGAVPAVAGRLSAVPSTSKMTRERALVTQRAFDEETPGIVKELMEKTGKKGWNELWDLGLSRMRDEAVQRAVEQLERQYQQRLERQGELARQLSRVSPSATFLACATSLAGTGTQDYYQLVKDMDRFRRASGEARIAGAEKLKEAAREKKIWWQKLPYPFETWPALQETHPQVASVFGQCWMDIAVLVLLSVGGLMAAYLGFMRSDVH